MLKLPVRRQPLSEHSDPAEKSYEATLIVDHIEDQQWLNLSFATNPDGQNVSLFNLAVHPRHFAEVTRMMVEADPAAAIHAFGAAMQTAEVERRVPTESAVDAA